MNRNLSEIRETEGEYMNSLLTAPFNSSLQSDQRFSSMMKDKSSLNNSSGKLKSISDENFNFEEKNNAKYSLN